MRVIRQALDSTRYQTGTMGKRLRQTEDNENKGNFYVEKLAL